MGRTVASNATFLPSLVTRLKTAGAAVGDTALSIVTWAKSNPANAVLLTTTIASLGFSVSDVFGSTVSAPDVAKFVEGLDDIANKSRAKIDALGAASETAKTGASSETRQVDDETAIEVLSWARGFFGSPSTAVQAHRMLQAFVEMPLSEVKHGFAVYRLR